MTNEGAANNGDENIFEETGSEGGDVFFEEEEEEVLFEEREGEKEALLICV